MSINTRIRTLIVRKDSTMPASVQSFLVASVILLWVGSSWCQGVSVNWGAATAPIYDEHGVEGKQVLVDGCLVQLILDSDIDGIDWPDSEGDPSDDDVVVDSSTIGEGSFFEGKFSKNFSTGSLKEGMQVYVRAWNGSSSQFFTHFGNSRLMIIPAGIAITVDATAEGPWATVELFTGISQAPASIRTYRLSLMQNFPNPFTVTTTIPFSVPGRSISEEKASISVDIYDVSGRLVRELVREKMLPGAYQVVWDGKTIDGKDVPSAIYLCRLKLGKRTGTRKILLLR